MVRGFLALIAALCCLNVSTAADRPEWAFFVPEDSPPPKGAKFAEPLPPRWNAPGSTRSYSSMELQDPLNPPDWYPTEHPPMPAIVAHPAQPVDRNSPVLPCALCHLPNGAGHVESAELAGLTSNYILRQLDDIRSGARQLTVGDPHSRALIESIKKSFANDQLPAAARYFSSLKARPWIRVVEADAVPRSFVDAASLMRLPQPRGGTEPLGRRIVELPENVLGLVNRDSHSGYIAYVPNGSIAAGEALVSKGGPGRTLACASCHGPKLTGLGDTPPLAGRAPSYLARQLWAFQSGARAGALSAGMKPVVASLTADEMLDIAAYLASLAPR
jgi:cytochrome c553